MKNNYQRSTMICSVGMAEHGQGFLFGNLQQNMSTTLKVVQPNGNARVIYRLD